MILCECGEFIERHATFVDYIKTSVSPSTRVIGHQDCGIIFNFVDEKPKRYSSKKELKSLAVCFAEKKELQCELLGKFLLEVDRLKSAGKFTDCEILYLAFKRLNSSSEPRLSVKFSRSLKHARIHCSKS